MSFGHDWSPIEFMLMGISAKRIGLHKVLMSPLTNYA